MYKMVFKKFLRFRKYTTLYVYIDRSFGNSVKILDENMFIHFLSLSKTFVIYYIDHRTVIYEYVFTTTLNDT